MMQCEKQISVHNPNGVHSRVATQLAHIARKHNVMLCIMHDSQVIDCSSILDVLSMAFTQGSSFVVRADGAKSERAICAVEELFSGKDV